MKLRVMVPDGILLEADAAKIVAEAVNGSFCLLPKHVDFVAALVPGLFSYTTGDGKEAYLALSDGILVKQGDQVLVSVVNGAAGAELGRLRELVERQFTVLEDRERRARSALARLEADFVRRFIELREE